MDAAAPIAARPSTKTASPRREPAPWQTGLVGAGAAGILSFQTSLLARARWQQAALTIGLSALGFGVGAAVNAPGWATGKLPGIDEVGARGAVAAVGGAGVLATTLALRGRPSLGMSTARMAAGIVGGGAVVDLALLGEQRLVDSVAGDDGGARFAAHATLLGGAAAGTAAFAFGKVRGSAMTRQAELARAALYAGMPMQTPGLAPMSKEALAALQVERAALTTVSGGEGSFLPAVKHTKAGNQFISDVTTPSQIAKAMDVDVASVKAPIRIYGGMHHGATDDELVENIFQEALRLDAFDRKTVVVLVPSGTGYAHPAPLIASETLTLGDMVTIVPQYGDLPSTSSLGKVPDATALTEKLLKRFADHIATLPTDKQPKLVATGESLGAWALQGVFPKGTTAEMATKGVSRIWGAGTPRLSAYRQHLPPGGFAPSGNGEIFEFDNVRELEALTPEARAKVTSFMFTRRNDPIARFDPKVLVQPPEYLSSREFADGVPRKMKWYPIITGAQMLFDNMNGTKVGGKLGREGHTYNGDAALPMAHFLDVPATPKQLTAILDITYQAEIARKGPV